MTRSEFAPAKINLTLEVLGRRPDGYHELRSLTVFAADVGDRLSLSAIASEMTHVSGPFAPALSGENLVDKALDKLAKAVPGIELGQIELEKNLPVASGIGGGSADAAAALRLLAGAYPAVASLDLSGIAKSLGADVPVCLESRAAVMTGVGEHVRKVELWPDDIFAVLINPLVETPSNKTAEVFKRLAAGPLDADHFEVVPQFSTSNEVLAYALDRANTLQKPAREIFPAIDDVVAALNDVAGCRLARLSGAGPTCFGIFGSNEAAEAAAAELNARHATWWVRPTRLV